MEDGDPIELDDVRVVDVTGTSHSDNKRRNKKKKKTCKLSLRDTTLLMFLGLLTLYGLFLFVCVLMVMVMLTCVLYVCFDVF